MVMSARVTDALTCIPPRKIRARLLGCKHTSLKFLVEVSLLKNSFALSPAPGSGAEYAVLVVFRPCFWALLECRSGRQVLFQQAGAFCELLRPNAVLGGWPPVISHLADRLAHLGPRNMAIW